MVLQVIKQVDGSCLLFDIEGRNFLYHSCFATCLIDIEMYKGTCVAAEYDLIGRVRLFAHGQRHDVRVVLCCTPVILLMAIVVHSLESHVSSYLAR